MEETKFAWKMPWHINYSMASRLGRITTEQKANDKDIMTEFALQVGVYSYHVKSITIIP